MQFTSNERLERLRKFIIFAENREKKRKKFNELALKTVEDNKMNNTVRYELKMTNGPKNMPK